MQYSRSKSLTRVWLQPARWRSRGTNFFVQAEDGIRDYKVTGVQTCALPISLTVYLGDWMIDNAGLTHLPPPLLAKAQERSEERRVEKECRSRWSPYH